MCQTICQRAWNNSQNILFDIHKDIFACLFSIHNIISLSCHEQVSLSLSFTCSWHDKLIILYFLISVKNKTEFLLVWYPESDMNA